MIDRVAYLSMHTSPLLAPGAGYAGGMNVYIDELARTMAARAVDVVVFTRRTDGRQDDVVEVADRYRVVHVDAGPATEIPIADMPSLVGTFTDGVLGWAAALGPFDLVHSHYWLSGWSGVIAKEALAVPMANSFHTLGRVKDLGRRPDDGPSSPLRLLTEEEVIARSDCVIAATPYELDDLVEHYGASPERLCVSPPGVDHDVFSPGDRMEARRWLGLRDAPIVLFVGRIQPLKGIDVAIDAVAAMDGEDTAPQLVVIGGPSGPMGELELVRLRRSAIERGIAARVHFVPPQAHHQLARFYRAADVLVMPSRSESFGLVAAEAQACGLPVVAARVGGLPFVIADGESGILVDGHDPAAFAAAIQAILEDRRLAARLSRGAVAHAEQFSWPATADRLMELYAGIATKVPS